MVAIISRASETFKKEPNLQTIKEPIVIVGDIHGQFYDLVHMLDKAGDPGQVNYLFLGDYVDRGIYSFEVVLLLFAMKLNFPSTMIMLRGNHECRNMTDHFTFREECLQKADLEVYDLLMEAFDNLPIACLADKKYLAMHGGISPELKKIENINKADRHKEPPLSGLVCDLLWADPIEDDLANS